MNAKKVPLRMCMGCGARKPKKELIRVVRDKDGNISVDTTGRAQGRGAYVCRNAECVKKLRKSRALNRTFKCEVADEVYALIEEEILGKKE